ncbi:MAG: deoxyribodipyrimidine photo-lyase, partial [Chthoniobacterales bacterium]|nr:deoxyribodipyrimidine photo-lyase [Chthoniobacterales bacterium]
MDNKVVIHWFRKDLRLTDNTSLLAAASAGKVVPVYLLSTWRGEHRWTGSKRQTFLCHCLRDLAISLERVGSRLILRSGSAVEEIPRLACEVGAIEVHTNRDYDLYGKKIEQKLQNILSSQGVVFKTHKDSVIWEGREILTINGEPFRVFTPYSRAWRNACFSNNFRPAPERLPAPDFLFQLHSLSLPTPAYWNLPDETENILPGGETQARRRLEDFFNSGKIFEYSNKRDFPALEATSRFSQDLRFGLISIREIFQRCQKASISSPKT